ncbi:putative Dol-P-Glc:Glc(2)Man(9)GlcNAc(2)-PP-Dol alpha-1,2-glucosyltransferase [Scylla paramamosain]|uniref:putative Dol-P-Glc:Glc(2)Man(9)GlcNAc(2)-PP-Dol alpha-1,2-glucosyltransferase n=1 Tax=Scylla paramamosain TaxID=85552 RepID=UPI003082DB4A
MGTPQPSFIFPLVVGSFTAVSYVFLVAVYTVQPTPFIDEAFHVPQAQKYCAGKFKEWDAKITTLPGLYLFSIGLNGPVSWVLGRQLCDVFSLRVTNLVAAAFMLSSLHKLLTFLHGTKVDGWKLILAGVNLSLLPVMYWFTFLYYTDTLATLVVLVMMLLHFHRAPTAAAAMGVVAVMMRQTNIIWVGFLCVLQAADVLGARMLKAPINTVNDAKTLVKRLRKTATKPYRLAEVLADVVVECFGYGMVLVSFLVFVGYNGGIVVGDRSAHQATLHLPQLGYFALFFIIFSLPHVPHHIKPFLRVCQRRPGLCAAMLVAGVMAVHSNTLVHPYLLADNRHLTFYLWNRFYGKYAAARYIMVPVYMFGGFMVHSFIQSRSLVFRLLYLFCVAATLVPQRLLEPRYFIIPFLVARLQTASRSWWQLWAETLYFLLINCLTLYLFVSKTFLWEDSTELQRIIW